MALTGQVTARRKVKNYNYIRTGIGISLLLIKFLNGKSNQYFFACNVKQTLQNVKSTIQYK
ncbi:hypothetical protein SRABI134_04442 [Peribacillus sp. Bi134]|nr:hypothetical protein SRABI134_04442 [Peribacillus sp. Bi134]